MRKEEWLDLQRSWGRHGGHGHGAWTKQDDTVNGRKDRSWWRGCEGENQIVWSSKTSPGTQCLPRYTSGLLRHLNGVNRLLSGLGGGQ